jgi:hypothetical protein
MVRRVRKVLFFDMKDKESCQRHAILLTPHNLLCGEENETDTVCVLKARYILSKVAFLRHARIE